MGKLTHIVNPSGDFEENVERLAKHLGKAKIRRQIFNVVYGRARRLRSKKELMKDAGISDEDTKSQQVQNELDHLSRHHLIDKHENDGITDDGAVFVYGKNDFVRSNRAEIVRRADDPRSLRSIATKRRPVVGNGNQTSRAIESDLKKRNRLNVLYLTASPIPASHLRVDAEMRGVQETIRASKFRDNVSLEYRPAADLDSLINGLNDHRPQIVHFSGHGNDNEIATDTGKSSGHSVSTLSYNLLAKALAATDNPPEVIVLNSCKSSAAIRALLSSVKIVISMKSSISDIAASAFAIQFYAAIAAGQSVKSAFEQGKVAVESVSIDDADTPEINCGSHIDPSRLILT